MWLIVINVHEGGYLMMMYQHALIVGNDLEQFFESIIVDSVVAFSARSVVNKRSAILLVNMVW